ncbi:MAG TPA: helix-hairpin-helix domain-containing protein, partial [Actinomycetaceae bacterium]|nr:helix-hairpin-helix domain-containing protein [Actinomycetaceae bacterium]
LVTIPGDPAAASPSIPADAAPVTAESGSPSAESASPSAESGSPSAAPDSDASGGALSSEQNVGGVAGGEVVVHVTGAVNVPGVFTLPVGSRIDDAILLAGGFAPDANEGGLNRALVLQDGQQVRVPRIGEELPPSAEVGPGGGSGASGGSSGSGGGNASGSGSGGKVNLNRASSQELETLPGIGPSLAGAIIRWREANGDFTSVSKLDDVPGIGPVLMDRLADLVTV